MVPKKSVRPTQDRVREALFSMIGDRIHDSRFLDLFAGSGVVGLEAWSRGAAHVCWVESDRTVVRQLKSTIEELCGSATGVRCCNVVPFIQRGIGDQFDIVFADPPYDRRRGPRGSGGVSGSLWTARILDGLRVGEVVTPAGLAIIEQASELPIDAVHKGWHCVDDRVYGDTRLGFFEQE